MNLKQFVTSPQHPVMLPYLLDLVYLLGNWLWEVCRERKAGYQLINTDLSAIGTFRKGKTKILTTIIPNPVTETSECLLIKWQKGRLMDAIIIYAILGIK